MGRFCGVIPAFHSIGLAESLILVCDFIPPWPTWKPLKPCAKSMYYMNDVLVEELSMILLQAIKVLSMLDRRGCYRCFKKSFTFCKLFTKLIIFSAWHLSAVCLVGVSQI
jgi:hypothetical protein